MRHSSLPHPLRPYEPLIVNVALTGMVPKRDRVPHVPVTTLPGSFLSRAELRMIGKLVEAARHLELLRRWTLKEAIAKATGLGAQLPFEEIDLGSSADGLTCRLHGSRRPGIWRAATLPTSAGVVAAVALEGGWNELIQASVRPRLSLARPVEAPGAPGVDLNSSRVVDLGGAALETAAKPHQLRSAGAARY